MKVSDLVIERINVDVFTSTRKDGNNYLLELSNYLQQYVFPEVEKRMEGKFPENAELELNVLNMDWATGKTEDWSSEFSQHLIQTLTEELEQKYGEGIDRDNQVPGALEFNSLATLLGAVDEIEVEHLPLLSVLVHFLNSGVLIKSDRGIETVKDLEALFIASFDPALVKPLTNFLLENEQGLRRFFSSFSVLFYKFLFEKRTSPDLARFLAEISVFEAKMSQIDLNWAKIALKGHQFSLSELCEDLEVGKTRFSTVFYNFIKKNDKITLKKHYKIIKKLMKSLNPDSPSALNLWIKRQCSEIQSFIHFLQRDFSLRELLDELLVDQALKYAGSFQDFTEWQNAFVDSIACVEDYQTGDQHRLSKLLMELEGYQPTYDQFEDTGKQEIDERAKRLRNSMDELITLLEKRVEVLEALADLNANKIGAGVPERDSKVNDLTTKSDAINLAGKKEGTTQTIPENLSDLSQIGKEGETYFSGAEMGQQVSENSKPGEVKETEARSFQSKNSLVSASMKTLLENEDILAPYSGLVLLNPFLPQLFRNLKLLNEKNEWVTDEGQIWALFILHYLASGNQGSIPEDELVLLKLLTNYPLDEPIREMGWKETSAPFSTEKGQVLLTKIKSEMEHILDAVRTNWRPMRNCSWPGLRQDFLSRPGTLHKKNEQLVLTVNPHALDMMLPHKNWGHSMIKYSWMDEVLYVEWGTE